MLRNPITLTLLAFCVAHTLAAKQPNILFILADDMGWQDSSVPFTDEPTPFNKRYHTPALERLASEGVKFTQAYSNAVCTPSRVSFMTGQSEARHGVTQWTHLSGDKPSSDLKHPTLSFAPWNWNGLQPVPNIPHSIHTDTLPERLHDSGYTTMIIGKGHLGATSTPGGDPQAFFDIRIGGRSTGGPGDYSGLKLFASGGNLDSPWRAWDLDEYFGQDIHLTEVLTRKAAAEIRKSVEADKPFFCYVSHFAPHTPIQADERFAPDYRKEGLDDIEAAYASLLAGVDKSVGDLLDLLDELQIADETIVVFTSDNGGLSHNRRSMGPPHTHNAPLSSGKGAHHDGGTRVPLIVRWPGLSQADTSESTPVAIYDWYPTLINVARETPASFSGIDGLDLAPLLKDAAPPPTFDRPLFWHFPNFWGPLHLSLVEGPGMGPCSVIRHGDWKLIYYHVSQSFELFNLSEDLGETDNLASKLPGKTKKLARELGNYLRSVEAPMPIVTATGQAVPWPDEL